jgi:hypothetical protein
MYHIKLLESVNIAELLSQSAEFEFRLPVVNQNWIHQSSTEERVILNLIS